jgi:ATP-dependent RNA circularization protein (DNA/RNA ligase family)
MKVPFKSIRRTIPKIVQPVGPNAWHIALEQNPWIEKWCKENPDHVVYGEIFGPQVQGRNFHYGKKENEIGFLTFDVLENGKWVDNKELFDNPKYSGLEKVPLLYRGKYDLKIIEKLAEEKENYNNAGHVREGVVVKPVIEKHDTRLGRVALKYVSNQYLLKS